MSKKAPPSPPIPNSIPLPSLEPDDGSIPTDDPPVPSSSSTNTRSSTRPSKRSFNEMIESKSETESDSDRESSWPPSKNQRMKLKVEALQISLERRYIAIEAHLEEMKHDCEISDEFCGWKSSQVKSDCKSWNHVVTAPPDGLFPRSDDQTKINLLKEGLYRISGNVSALSDSWKT